MGSLDDKISRARPRTRQYTALLDGELRDRYDELTDQLVQIRRDVQASLLPKDQRKLADPDGVTERTVQLREQEAELLARAEQLVEAAADSSVTFVVRDIGQITANVVTAKARKEYEGDDDPFATRIGLALVRAAVVSIDGETEVTDRQWCELFGGTYLDVVDGVRKPVTVVDNAIAQADATALVNIVNELNYSSRNLPATPAG